MQQVKDTVHEEIGAQAMGLVPEHAHEHQGEQDHEYGHVEPSS
jgi:hypothetical protein